MWDIGVLKIYCTLFGIVVGAYASMFVREHVAWFIVAIVVLAVGLGVRWFTAGPR